MDTRPFNIISICSGIGGLDLAFRVAVPEARTVCYLEREAYPLAVLVARIEDQTLDDAPIWTDLSTFDGKPWHGVVDGVIAGLPCQPYSAAGKKKGEQDERYIWPEFFRIVRETSPPLVFLENVPGLLAWFRPIGEELCSMGYEIEAGIFSASEVGAPHQRKRLFVLAHRRGTRRPEVANSTCRNETKNEGGTPKHRDEPQCDVEDVDNTTRTRQGSRKTGEGWAIRNETRGKKPSRRRHALGDAQCSEWGQNPQRQGGAGQGEAGVRGSARRGKLADNRSDMGTFPPGPNEDWSGVPEALEPALRRVADGTTDRVGELSACGNSVVPLTAAKALVILLERAKEKP